MSVFQALVDMGYSTEKAMFAAENDRNIDQALDVIERGRAAVPNEAPATEAVVPGVVCDGAAAANTELVAASYKCMDCGKLLANEEAIMFHASKTKHENYGESSEEVKPLSAEEKAAKVLQIREKIKTQQEKKAVLNAEEAREKERKRREDGKAMISHKEAARDREVREAAAERRREKAEDDIARQRVLEQIRLDKEERKARAAGQPVPKPAAPVAPVVVDPPKDYTSTTIQFRLLDGKTVRQQFEATEPLAMVYAWIRTNYELGKSFSLMTPFPRKVFSENNMGTTLKELNLVPSANIVLNRLA